MRRSLEAEPERGWVWAQGHRTMLALPERVGPEFESPLTTTGRVRVA